MHLMDTYPVHVDLSRCSCTLEWLRKTIVWTIAHE